MPFQAVLQFVNVQSPITRMPHHGMASESPSPKLQFFYVAVGGVIFDSLSLFDGPLRRLVDELRNNPLFPVWMRCARAEEYVIYHLLFYYGKSIVHVCYTFLLVLSPPLSGMHAQALSDNIEPESSDIAPFTEQLLVACQELGLAVLCTTLSKHFIFPVIP
ncbi:hypothetical protein HBH56_126750 [Parastagonospora nodorum]|uniref:Uncharacterized protein n=1 Tax=Phaeosphaeria nodorum (strain SN15 / ATCC MYA-4574 / FGSC 10173) TaxID=321614 RepID=A0A7U2I9M5_PHANO|nr:hypothetical protein HBH56_126750 [Parastagonospora nodorum]QRD05800.1 hypothetical protein JI435_060720 [Parastagonospora nodorum SN15]KAH3931629.1 hypothetical protein HBH54_096750 [Parastagonospora nodorum]KAH3970807.1 hypothetical protein HBH51_113460 [Parastagonospora nodorum]KAH4028650.1 hypothetical protein HBI09_139920 [Parastagonospora nodorum]